MPSKVAHNKQSQLAPAGPDLAPLGRCSERYSHYLS